MAVRWLALLPASKGVTEGGTGPDWRDVADGPARDLLDVLDHDEATDRPDHPGDRPTTAAWRRYDGVVHRTLDPGSLEGAARERFRRHVAYVSALAGFVAPTDPLPAYRLEMAHVHAELGGLGPWWRDHVAAALTEALAPGACLWLLTGGEYARAVAAPDGVEVVEPRLLRPDGTRSLPSATLKQCRGGLARLLCEQPRLARRPTDDAWAEHPVVAAGTPVRFAGTDDDGQPVWRAEG